MLEATVFIRKCVLEATGRCCEMYILYMYMCKIYSNMAAYTLTSLKSFQVEILIASHDVWQMGLKDVNVYANTVQYIGIRVYIFVSLHMKMVTFVHLISYS